jgi:hypothetical protein
MNTNFDPSQIPDPSTIEWDHIVARLKLYDDWRKQLDNLWHDIDNGLFGDAAKTGAFYTSIKSVKDTHPVGSIHKPFADLKKQG